MRKREMDRGSKDRRGEVRNGNKGRKGSRPKVVMQVLCKKKPTEQATSIALDFILSSYQSTFVIDSPVFRICFRCTISACDVIQAALSCIYEIPFVIIAYRKTL